MAGTFPVHMNLVTEGHNIIGESLGMQPNLLILQKALTCLSSSKSLFPPLLSWESTATLPLGSC